MKMSENLEIIQNFNLLSYPVILIDDVNNILWFNEKANKQIDKSQLKNWLTLFENNINQKVIKIDNIYYQVDVSSLTIESINYTKIDLSYIKNTKEIDELVAEQSDDAILIFQDKILYSNAVFEELLGFTKEYFEEKNFYDLLNNDNKTILYKNLNSLIEYKKSNIKFILSIEKADGNKLWISVKTKAIIENSVPLYISIVKNITAAKFCKS